MCCFEYFFPKLTTKNIWKIDNYNHWRQFYLDHRKLLTDAALSSWCKREGRDVLRTEKRNVCAWKFVGNKLLRGWYFQFSCLELEDAKGHIINLILFHSFLQILFCWWLGQETDTVENVSQFGEEADEDVNVICDLKCYQFLITRLLPLSISPGWND